MKSEELIELLKVTAWINHRQLEIMAGVPETTICKALAGSRKISDKNVAKILVVFHDFYNSLPK